MRCLDIKTVPCRNYAHRKGRRASLIKQKGKYSSKPLTAPLLQEFTLDADVQRKVSKNEESWAWASCLGGPVLFPSVSEEERKSSLAPGTRTRLLRGGQERGDGFGHCHCCARPCERQDLKAAACELSISNWSLNANCWQLKCAGAELQQFSQILLHFFPF